MLKNIRIVLARPSHPGNVGAAARAMKTMGLSELWLVAPAEDPRGEAAARAVGAQDVLEAARVVDSLDQAIANCALVIGTSARARRIDWPTLDPHDCAGRLVAASGGAPVALLFGHERTGLTNEELDRCRYVTRIPSDPEFSSLNLAASVQILCYEIFRAAGRERTGAPRREAMATHEEMRGLYRHLNEALVAIGFLDPANPRLLMRRLIRLFNRAALDRNELNILRGILTAVSRLRAHDGTKPGGA